MDRSLTPEWLDWLPADDARAVRSRTDLRRINTLMANARWWRDVVAPRLGPADRVLEIGPGDAGFPLLPGRCVDGLDRMPRPPGWPRAARWHRSAVQDFDCWDQYSAVVGNLVFHHFTPAELAALGARLSRHCRVIAACEPRRGRRFQRVFRLLAPLVARSEVTRHDALASIAAGFRDDELPEALGLAPEDWTLSVEPTARGAYRMLAVRKA